MIMLDRHAMRCIVAILIILGFVALAFSFGYTEKVIK